MIFCSSLDIVKNKRRTEKKKAKTESVNHPVLVNAKCIRPLWPCSSKLRATATTTRHTAAAYELVTYTHVIAYAQCATACAVLRLCFAPRQPNAEVLRYRMQLEHIYM